MDVGEAFQNVVSVVEARLPGYEERPEQRAMAQAVLRAFESNRHLIVEAGTGVGKSFAYLIPSILWAVENKEHILVSTNTISLQEQLITKDIPFLQAVMPQEFVAVLAKGRSNYLCIRRLAQCSRHQKSLFSSKDIAKHLWMIEDWAYTTKDGSLSDFTHLPSPHVWGKVCAERGNCLGRKCTYYKRCFYIHARRRMYNADLLVVNHHLFFANLALLGRGASFLPRYDRVIFDEAHSLEDAAASHLGIHLTNHAVNYLLNSLYNPRTRKGFLTLVGDAALLRAVRGVKRIADDTFKRVAEWRQDSGGANGRVTTGGFVPNDLSPALADLARELKEVAQTVETDEEELELARYTEKCKETAVAMEMFVTLELDDHVYWVEAQRRRGLSVSLECAPVDISADMGRLLFDELGSVVMTSATLAVGRQHSFDFFKNRWGIEDCDELRLGSPFNFKEQVKVYVPRNLTDPDGAPDYVAHIIEAIRNSIMRTHGKAFVLFTNYALMNRAYGQLKPLLEQEGIVSFCQGEGMPRTLMIQKFRQDVDSVIFGTDSFWQGIDIQGPALSNVTIVKLPFSVPDRQLIEARLERVSREGGRPVWDYSLPEAIIRLRQGVGRLIRSKRDTGIVVILDSRIHSRSYGRMFLESLPEMEIMGE